jgi:hypothetical protein
VLLKGISERGLKALRIKGFVIPAQEGIQHLPKNFSISSTGYPDLDPITESILVYTLLLHCQ